MAGQGAANPVLINALHQALVIGHLINANQKRMETCVSRNNLQSAFKLISDYKQGRLEPNSDISDEQIALLGLLCADLLPNEKFSPNELDSLVTKIAQADTRWNKECQITIGDFYALTEAGKTAEAQQVRCAFVDACPSSWYRGIVESI